MHMNHIWSYFVSRSCCRLWARIICVAITWKLVWQSNGSWCIPRDDNQQDLCFWIAISASLVLSQICVSLWQMMGCRPWSRSMFCKLSHQSLLNIPHSLEQVQYSVLSTEVRKAKSRAHACSLDINWSRKITFPAKSIASFSATRWLPVKSVLLGLALLSSSPNTMPLPWKKSASVIGMPACCNSLINCSWTIDTLRPISLRLSTRNFVQKFFREE